jgi:arylsulfatase A-like enzyme
MRHIVAALVSMLVLAGVLCVVVTQDQGSASFSVSTGGAPAQVGTATGPPQPPFVPPDGIRSRPLGHSPRTRPTVRATNGQRVNIVEVLLDDMRVDDLAYAPNVRRLLGHDGVDVRNMFSSYPLCCPARASFFSGLLPHNHHVYDVKPPYAYGAFDDRRTIATSLHAVGYSTGLVGKYLNGYGQQSALAPRLTWGRRSPAAAFAAAHVISQFYVPAGWDDWEAGIGGRYCSPACGGEYHYFNYAYTDNGVPTASPIGRYSSQVIGGQAARMIRAFHRTRVRDHRPFFVSTNFIAPHIGSGLAKSDTGCSYESSDGQPATLTEPAAPAWAWRIPMIAGITRGAGVRSDGTAERSIQDKPGLFATLPPFTASERACVRHNTQARAAAVAATDRAIGRLIRTLKETGEWKRTVVALWSDNGYFQGEHRRPIGKTITYDPVSRVPLIVTGPGMRGGSHRGALGGQDRDTPMTVVDLSRTLEAMAGARPPHRADGQDMSSVLTGADTGWREAVPLEFAEISPRVPGDDHRDPAFAPAAGSPTQGVRDGIVDPRTGIGLHTGRFYFVRYDDGEAELYDLHRDPDEWHNLMSRPAWLRRHHRLIRQLDLLWTGIRNCSGRRCHPVLPHDLTLDAAQNRAETEGWWHAMRLEYGSNHPHEGQRRVRRGPRGA